MENKFIVTIVGIKVALTIIFILIVVIIIVILTLFDTLALM